MAGISGGSYGIIAFLAVGAALAGCGGDENDADLHSEAFPAIELDSEITDTERQSLESALDALGSLGIEGQNTKWFPEIFGGTGSSDVANYFDERIHFFLSSKTDVAERVRINGDGIESDPVVPKEPRIGAINWGAVLWLFAKAAEPDTLTFEINGDAQDVPSTRVGIMQLGPMFGSFELVERTGIFVHEARHSDCTGGLHSSDLAAIRAGAAPANLECGHLHVDCPQGHELAGLPGCDGDPWGAYTVQWVYAASIVLGCPSCSETERQVATIAAIDSSSRLVFDVKMMVDGGFGPPDMSSSSDVVGGL